MKNKPNIPYKVPEGYFAQLEDKLKQKGQSTKGFRVPDNYFEQLNQKILLENGVKKPKGRVVVMRKWLPAMAVAASLFLVWMIWNPLKTKSLVEPSKEMAITDEHEEESLELLYDLFIEEPEMEDLPDKELLADFIDEDAWGREQKKSPEKESSKNQVNQNQNKNSKETTDETAEQLLYEMFIEEDDYLDDIEEEFSDDSFLL